MRTVNKKRYSDLCKEITDTCDCKGGYCFWRMLIEHQHPSLRMLVQMGCIEKYKYEESVTQKKDIGNSAAAMEWVDKGYAKAFSEVYDEDLSLNEIYRKTVEKVKLIVDKSKKV